MNTANEVKKTEEVNKYFRVAAVGCYGQRETLEETIAEAQKDALSEGCDQLILKAVKVVRRPDAAIYTKVEDIH